MSSSPENVVVLDLCRRLHEKNFLAAADGNVSMRLPSGDILITPSARNKAFITDADLAVVTLDNRVVRGTPSGERLLHLQIYRRCSEANVVVHAHPPTAIAWSVARPELRELPREALSEVILAVGSIPIAPYAEPGTSKLVDSIDAFLPQHRAIILARHGAVSWGESAEEAYNGMERLEHTALILKSAHELGGITSLDPAEVVRLIDVRKRMGGRTL